MFASIYSAITKHSCTVQTESIRNVEHSMLCELGEDQQTTAMTGEIGSEQRRTMRPVVLPSTQMLDILYKSTRVPKHSSQQLSLHALGNRTPSGSFNPLTPGS